MGSFLANLHVNTGRQELVAAALASLGLEARTSPATHGWVGVWEPRANTQDEGWITRLCCQLSARTKASTVAFLLHDSDVVRCWLAQDGTIVTHVDSWPGYPDTERNPVISTPAALLDLCPELTEEGLQELLEEDRVFADELLEALAVHLRIPLAHVLASGDEDDGDPSSGASLQVLAEQLAALAVPIPADQGGAELVQAAHAGNLRALAAQLDAGASPDAHGPWRPSKARSGPAAGMFPEITATPLYAAASENQVAAITLLLAQGADPDLAIPRGDIPLCAAACAGHVDAVSSLLAGGANPHATRREGSTAADMVAGTQEQMAMISGFAGKILTLPSMRTQGFPSAKALEACAILLREAMEQR
jgi:hypothetical protein